MLYLIATPIGNLDDLSPRAVAVLKQATILACEDTRRTRILLERYEIKPYPRLVSYREGIEATAAVRIADAVERGEIVACCTDGGYPGISDPGYRLIQEVVERNLPFTVLPGASAVPVALLLSGLSTSSYVFKGYPPPKPGARRRFFAEEAAGQHTLVLFESPMRTASTLKAAYAVLGDRKAAVCRELTKKFEQVTRGFLSELCQKFEGANVKGEVTLVIAGNNPKFCRESAGADAEVGADADADADAETDASEADQGEAACPAIEQRTPAASSW